RRPVRHRHQRGLRRHPGDAADGAVALAPARAVGDRHVGRVERFELADRPPQDRLLLGVTGREELHRERGCLAGDSGQHRAHVHRVTIVCRPGIVPTIREKAPATEPTHRPARACAPATTDDRCVTDTDLPAAVQRVLEHYLARAAGDLAEKYQPFGEAVAALRAFVLNGGKRLRPTFAWWGWRAAGGAADGPAAEGALHAAASLELIQACALIHDDLMDASAIRRGAPTV